MSGTCDYLYILRGQISKPPFTRFAGYPLSKGGKADFALLPPPPSATGAPLEWATYVAAVCKHLSLCTFLPDEAAPYMNGLLECAPWNQGDAAAIVVRSRPKNSPPPRDAVWKTQKLLSFLFGSPLRAVLELRVDLPELQPTFMVYGGPEVRPHPNIRGFMHALSATRGGGPGVGLPMMDVFLDHYCAYLTAESPGTQFLHLWNCLEAAARGCPHFAAGEHRVGRELLDRLQQACESALTSAGAAPALTPEHYDRYKGRLRAKLGELCRPTTLEIVNAAIARADIELPAGCTTAWYQMRNCVVHTGSCRRLGGRVCAGRTDRRRFDNCQRLPVDANPVASLWHVTVLAGTHLCWGIDLPQLLQADQAQECV